MFRKKIAIIGSGAIGGVIAQLSAARRLGDTVLFDIVEGMPQGKSLDISEGSKLDGFHLIVSGANTYEGISNADLVIVTAGIPRKPGMSRDDLLTVNAKIMRNVAEAVKENAPNAVVIVLSNPLDAMVTLFQRISGFPHNKVLGQAGVLDSSRFSTFISWELGVSVKDVNAMVLGGHGDTMVPIVRYANVNGIPVMQLLEKKYKDKVKAKDVMDKMVERTKMAGGEIVKLLKNGSAFYSPAASAVEMAESILLDEKRVLPVSAYLQGEFGVNGYYGGVPVILGEHGVEKIIEFDLNEEELNAFNYSINSVKSLVADMERLGL